MAQYAEGTLLASGARTTTQTLMPTGALISPAGTPVLLEVTIDLTAFTTTASLTPAIQIYDIGKGAYIPVLTGAAIAANSTVVLRLGPDVLNVTNLSQQGIISPLWRVVVTHGNANSHTYSVSARLLAA